MTDLFESKVEHHAERLAIMQESGVENAEQLAAADRLRDDVRAAWKQRRIEEAGQA